MPSETATQLMDAAKALIQDRGYNAFSFKDLAEEVGIRTASVHYHFPAKGDLGVALMQRYLEDLEGELARLDRAGRSCQARLEGFLKLYGATESAGAICLCGSLASDLETLPPELQDVVETYLDRSETWIADVIREGVRAGEFTYDGKPADLAAWLLSSLQGGLILARARSRPKPFLPPVQRVLLRNLGF